MTNQQPDAPIDALPESLTAARSEHAEIMQRIQDAQRFIEVGARRGIFLEGVIKAWGAEGPEPERELGSNTVKD